MDRSEAALGVWLLVDLKVASEGLREANHR